MVLNFSLFSSFFHLEFYLHLSLDFEDGAQIHGAAVASGRETDIGGLQGRLMRMDLPMGLTDAEVNQLREEVLLFPVRHCDINLNTD